MQKKYKKVLFDLDGTLADTAPTFAYIINNKLSVSPQIPVSVAKIRQWVTYGGKEMLTKSLPIAKDSALLTKIHHEFNHQYASNISDKTVLFPGISELLTKLHSLAINWGVVTNKHRKFTIPLLQALGLAQSLTVCVCGDDTDFPKPNPTPLLLACESLKCDATECVFVGDSIIDIQAAESCHMDAVLANYGYGRVNHIKTKHCADTPLEIIDYL